MIRKDSKRLIPAAVISTYMSCAWPGFSLGCTFFLKKLMTFFVVVLNAQAKTAKFTTPMHPQTLQLSPPSKNFLTNLTFCSAWESAYTCNLHL